MHVPTLILCIAILIFGGLAIHLLIWPVARKALAKWVSAGKVAP